MTARALVCLALVLAGAGTASAQTVMVRNAEPGAPIEVLLNVTAVGSGAADADGNATVAVRPPQGTEPGDFDAFLFVDTCGSRRRILIVASVGTGAALEAGCVRQEIPGLFLVRSISTLVVDVGGASPTVLLRQGPYDPSAARRASMGTAPTGLVLYGGGAFTFLGDPILLACGNVSACAGDDSGFGPAFGVDYWILPYAAATAGYMKPGSMSAAGVGSNYLFTNSLEAAVLTFGGKVGFPAGPARVYGKAGMNYQRSLFWTTQAIRATTIVVDGQTETIPGGVQTSNAGTSGWGWQFGAGLELWFSRRLGAYTEFEWAALKGSDRGDGEFTLDDSLMSIGFGVKVHIGR